MAGGVPECDKATARRVRLASNGLDVVLADNVMEWLALLVLGSCVIPGIPSPFEQGHILGNVGGSRIRRGLAAVRALDDGSACFAACARTAG